MTEQRTNDSFRIGLTGGIASGKSVVTEMFRELGATIVDTDVVARQVVQPGQPALGEIRERFGVDVFLDNGQLNREALRKHIFADDAARRALEAILHPRIGAETRRQAEAETGSVYQIIVVPLLVGSKLLAFMDRVLVVDCDEQAQLERLLARDAESPEQARRILAAQASRKERLAIADDIIRNDGSLADTRRQVERLDKRYRRFAAMHRPRGAR